MLEGQGYRSEFTVVGEKTLLKCLVQPRMRLTFMSVVVINVVIIISLTNIVDVCALAASAASSVMMRREKR